MTRRQKIQLAAAVVIILAAVAVSLKIFKRRAPRPVASVTLVGDVLKQDTDPAQQTPLDGVIVTAAQGSAAVTTHSSPSGFFSLTLDLDPNTGGSVVLTFKRPDYKILKLVATNPGDQLYIARMQPLQSQAPVAPNQPQAAAPAKLIQIKNVRVRYSLNEESTVDVGSLAKEFLAYNVGNIPCRGRRPCSPDGRWAAKVTTLPLDAEAGNEFRNVRVLCVAGPCAFTQIESDSFARPAQRIAVSVLNWSDPADFLVEADVTRIMATDSVQNSYPFLVGPTMNFALPPGSEGPSIEADLDGQYIVFPLGPALIVSWANCSVEASQNGNKIYRCQLKAGYRFAS